MGNEKEQPRAGKWNPRSWTLTEWAGVLGFLLAFGLGALQVVDRWQARVPSIRLGEIDAVSRVEKGLPISEVVFRVTLYHDRGRPVHIEALRFVARLRPPGSGRPGVSSGAVGGWGPAIHWVVLRNRLAWSCSVCTDSKCETPTDAHLINIAIFEEGDTIQCTAGTSFGQYWRWIAFDEPDAVQFEVWSQGKVTRSFDVTKRVQDAYARYVR